jgi:hypothetical protein
MVDMSIIADGSVERERERGYEKVRSVRVVVFVKM